MTPREAESGAGQEAEPVTGVELAARLQGLETQMQKLEARLAALEERPAKAMAAPVRPKDVAAGRAPAPLLAAGKAPAKAPEATVAEPSTAFGALSLAGLVFLALGGAFFFRAMTDSGQLPRAAGVAIGLAYALLWLAAAARAKRTVVAMVLTVAVSVIVFPLLWEATLKLKVLPPGGAALALLLSGSALMAVAWRRSLQAVAWAVTGLSIAMGAGLMFATGAFEAFSGAFIASGAGILWLTDGGRWQALRWPTSMAADWSAVVMTVLVTFPGDAPKDGATPSIPLMLALDMALVAVYLASVSARILRRRQPVDLFEGLQSTAAVVVGFGGAVLAAQNTGIGMGYIGATAMGAAAASYGSAWSYHERAPEERTNSLFFTSLALACSLAAGFLLIRGPWLGVVFSGLGLGAALLGIHLRRDVLISHGAIFLLAAGFASGLLKGFAGPMAPSFRSLGLPALLAFAALAAAFAYDRAKRDPAGMPWLQRIPATVLGTLLAMGIGEILLAAMSPLLGQTAQDPGSLTALRTGLLAMLSVALALASRSLARLGLDGLVRPLLAVAGLQLLLQAFPNGRPFTLFLAFSCFGAALALAPRWLKTRLEAPAD
ncbi:MAG TPA: hypothetical protein VJ483_04330 [Holophagaceae bacterium]|nr:hypothetical protein [Holophagaceae bacterium]